MLRVVLAGLHLLALGIGLFSVVYRGNALHEPPADASLRRAFKFDTMWGFAAILWIVTGLWRLFGSVEKPADYYEHNTLFVLKMVSLALILLLEISPMITLIRWRIQLKRGATPATFAARGTARRIAIISHVQALLVVLMVFVASAMARGFGAN
jgi:putative membrane protein